MAKENENPDSGNVDDSKPKGGGRGKPATGKKPKSTATPDQSGPGLRDSLAQAGNASLIAGMVVGTMVIVGAGAKKLSSKLFGDSPSTDED